MRIAFIGLGVMGRSMALNLIKGGFEVRGFARSKDKAVKLEALGIPMTLSLSQAVSEAECVITMVGGPRDVEDLYFRHEGILNSAAKGALLIDMTSSSPDLARRIHAEAQQRGLEALDAPVSGGDKGARAGTLSIFAGGDQKTFDRALPVFKAMGRDIILEGPSGAGQSTKLANQIMVAGSLAGMCEGFAFAKSQGLDLQKVFDSVRRGAAASASLELYGERIIAGDDQPGGALSYLVKDLRCAADALEGSGLDLNVAAAVLKNYATMQDEGDGALGTQALTWFYEKHRKQN
jgi:3-hydroxyisobutyrate dehydrogenase/2-hydroxy-3-oxopropionate reductase